MEQGCQRCDGASPRCPCDGDGRAPRRFACDCNGGRAGLRQPWWCAPGMPLLLLLGEENPRRDVLRPVEPLAGPGAVLGLFDNVPLLLLRDTSYSVVKFVVSTPLVRPFFACSAPNTAVLQRFRALAHRRLIAGVASCVPAEATPSSRSSPRRWRRAWRRRGQCDAIRDAGRWRARPSRLARCGGEDSRHPRVLRSVCRALPRAIFAPAPCLEFVVYDYLRVVLQVLQVTTVLTLDVLAGLRESKSHSKFEERFLA